MMTPKALAQLRRDTTQARHHLAFLECCMATGETRTGSLLLATPSMVEHARKTLTNMERLLADTTPQLALFNLPTPSKERRHMPQAWTIYRTGSERFTLTEAHPYHSPVGRLDHTGAGTYAAGVDPACPLCRLTERDDLPNDACPSCGRLGHGEPCDPCCGASE